LIAGFSSSASAGAIGWTSGRWAFDLGVFDFGGLDIGGFGVRDLSGGVGMAQIWVASAAKKRRFRPPIAICHGIGAARSGSRPPRSLPMPSHQHIAAMRDPRH